jgi:lysophospholipase L1-like esterase
MRDMKNILLYGDSFIWGVDATSGGRHAYEDRIGVIVQKELGSDYAVVSEGLRGRTMFGENGWFPERDGLAQFGPIFASHLPLDIAVLMLGTNDLNSRTRHAAKDIVSAINDYKQKMTFWCDFMKYPVPKVLIVSPPDIDETGLTGFADIFDGSAAFVPELKNALRGYAEQVGDAFLDASNVVVSKNTDGIHLDREENNKLGVALAEKLKEVLA